MHLAALQIAPEAALPVGSTLFRVQLSRARKTTLRTGPLKLASPGALRGRFDLAGMPVGYLAEAPETALYESLCRREAAGLSLARLAHLSLLCARTTMPMRLLDIRPHAASLPVLQSLRFQHTQEIAHEALTAGFDGIACLQRIAAALRTSPADSQRTAGRSCTSPGACRW